MSRFNLASPNGTATPCTLESLTAWLHSEIQALSAPGVRAAVSAVCANLDEFVSWPIEALLLWDGCHRVGDAGKQKYHRYPQALRVLAKTRTIDLDTRPNGPAIAAFQFAGGNRHARFGSSNAWSIHHLYSGKFPFQVGGATLHAVKNGCHFTQSAGLVAVHPIADAMCDEFPFFTWYLRAESFRRFGYDPDFAFDGGHDSLGFAADYTCSTIYQEPPVIDGAANLAATPPKQNVAQA